MTAPYYSDGSVALYHGDCRDLLPKLNLAVDLVCTDPPYGVTAFAWDRWPDGWPSLVPGNSMWCFGSMRMFLDRADDFAGWKFSQDVVWRKNHSSLVTRDRFLRVHEHALHWYRGDWGAVHHDQQRETHYGPNKGRTMNFYNDAEWSGSRGANTWVDDGTRGVRSVIDCNSMRKLGIHPAEKPIGILDPLIKYGCPPGGLVLDPFAGSGSTLDAARAAGRRAVGIETSEDYCEAIANRLDQQVIA